MSTFTPVDAWAVVDPDGRMHVWLVRSDRDWAIDAYTKARGGSWCDLESQGYRCVPCTIIPREDKP